MTGRIAAVCPGGRAMAQLVSTPPRAADTNEPLTNVGAAVGAGSNGTGGANGASGAPALVIDTGAPALDGPVSRSVPNANAPTAPAAALTPRRIIARRLSSGMRAIMPLTAGRPSGGISPMHPNRPTARLSV